jgi:hypothetical protein
MIRLGLRLAFTGGLTPSMLATALSARRRTFDAAGIGAIQRLGARQLRLDERHRLVSADWLAARAGCEPLRLESAFLIWREPEGLRVVVNLNRHDIAALLATSD